jgi:hypothetical protein
MTLDEIDAEILKIQRDTLEATRGRYANHQPELLGQAKERIRLLQKKRAHVKARLRRLSEAAESLLPGVGDRARKP